MDERLCSESFVLSWQSQSPDEVLEAVGEWLEEQGAFEAAAHFYAAAITLNSSNTLAYFRLGKLFLKQRDYAKAVDVLTKVSKLAFDHAPTWYHLAQAYWGMGDYLQAASAAEEALIIDPNHAGAFLIRLRVAQHFNDEATIKKLLLQVPQGLLSSNEVRRVAEEHGVSLTQPQEL